MSEFFGRNSDKDFRNMVDDPFLKAYGMRGFNKAHNCCGLAATGDDTVAAEEPAPVEVKAKVQNIKAWHYAKTALALVGLYVVIKYAYGKLKK